MIHTHRLAHQFPRKPGVCGRLRVPTPTLFLATTCASLLGACGDDAGVPVGPSETDRVASVQLTPPDRTVGMLGTRFRVDASAEAADGSALYASALEPSQFSWSSSAPHVAILEEETHPVTGRAIRLVKGLSEGTATISATSQGVTGSMSVTVEDRARLVASVEIGGEIGGYALGSDGTIYVAENGLHTRETVWHAISPQGSVLWTVALPYTERKLPAIAADGTLYLGSWSWIADRPHYSYAGKLLAVAPDGTVRWVLEGIEGIRSSPALGADGTIYVAGGRHVYAVDPQGDIRWTYEQDDNVFLFSSPAVGHDGTIYIGAEDHLLYAIDPDGTLRWTFEAGDRIRSSPSIGADGTIYVGSHDGRLYAIHPDGTPRWKVDLGQKAVTSAPSLGPDGTVYVQAAAITAVSPDGSIRWTYPATGGATTPVIGANGTVYVADQRVYALDPNGTLLWDFLAEHPAGGSPIIGFDGAIIAATAHGLVVIREHDIGNGGYTGAPWPSARGDRANTGRAGE